MVEPLTKLLSSGTPAARVMAQKALDRLNRFADTQVRLCDYDESFREWDRPVRPSDAVKICVASLVELPIASGTVIISAGH